MVSFPKLSIEAIVLAGGKSSRMGRDKATIAIGNVPLLHLICTVARKCASKIYIVTPRTEKYIDLVPENCHFIKEISESGETQGPLIAFSQALIYLKAGGRGQKAEGRRQRAEGNSRFFPQFPNSPIPNSRLSTPDSRLPKRSVSQSRLPFLSRRQEAESSLEEWDTRHEKTEEWVLLLACDLPLLNEAVLLEWRDYLTEVPETTMALLPKSEKGWEPLCGFYRLSCLRSLEEYIQQGGRSFQRWLAKQSVQELPVSDRRVLFNCNTPEDLTDLGYLLVQK